MPRRRFVVSDFQGAIRPGATEREKLWLARGSTFVAGLLATAMAVWLAWRGVTSLWDEYLKLIALIGGGFPGVFALGLLTRRANATGVIIGTLTSVAVTWWVQNYTQTSTFLHGFVAVASCMIVGYAASLLTARGAARPNLAGSRSGTGSAEMRFRRARVPASRPAETRALHQSP